MVCTASLHWPTGRTWEAWNRTVLDEKEALGPLGFVPKGVTAGAGTQRWN